MSIRTNVKGYRRPSDLVDALGERDQEMSGRSERRGDGHAAMPSTRPARFAARRRLSGRVVSIVTTLLGLLLLTFMMGRLLPADPVLAVTGTEVNRETYERVYRELGLDRPVLAQFVSYIGGRAARRSRQVADHRPSRRDATC